MTNQYHYIGVADPTNCPECNESLMIMGYLLSFEQDGERVVHLWPLASAGSRAHGQPDETPDADYETHPCDITITNRTVECWPGRDGDETIFRYTFDRPGLDPLIIIVPSDVPTDWI